jgi:hypothetical protein
MSGLTFKEILTRTPGNRVELSQFVKITYLKFGNSRKLGVPKAICQSYSQDKDRAGKVKKFKYVTMMEFYADSKVKVSCSCADHLYRWEYALVRKKASYFTYSNHEKPVETNPRLIPACCKHVIALYKSLKLKGLVPKKSQLPDVTV